MRTWLSRVNIVLAFGSMQLFALAVIGEYLGRTYMQTKGRPLFLIDEVLVHNNAHPESVDSKQPKDKG